MLFAVSAGSSGTGAERYVASVPFVLSAGRVIQLAEPLTSTLGGGQELRLERLQLRYTASLGPFASPEAALVGFNRLTAALLWSALHFQTGMQYPLERGEVRLWDAPLPIPDTEPIAFIGRVTNWTETDGHYDADLPAIRPDHKRLVRFEGGRANVTAGIAASNFVNALDEALAWPRLEAVARHDKLRLAIELFAAHKFEVSQQAQFVGLVTALEALLPDAQIGPTATTALHEARTTVLNARNLHKPASSEWQELDHLLSRVGKLQYQSIGSSMRDFVQGVVGRHTTLGSPAERAREVRDAYRVRSRLLHDGHVPTDVLAAHLSLLQTFVPALLSALFLETVGASKDAA